MRGREKFKKYKWILVTLQYIYSLFPRTFREKLFVHYRSKKGAIGMALRYALLKTLAESVGDNVSIHPDVYLFKINHLSIGNNVSIHPMCYIDACGGIKIGNDVSIAHNVSVISFNHRYDEKDIPIKDQGVILNSISICDNVWIGAKAVILSDVTVNAGCVVGASAVVSKDVPPDSVVVGIPAKVIKKR